VGRLTWENCVCLDTYVIVVVADQTAIPQRNYLLQSHARDRSLTFAPQQLPENLDHQATAARGRTARRGLIRDEISAASFSRLDSIHSHRRDSRPLQACQLEQLDGIAGMEPELTDTQAKSHMFQQRKTTGILHGVPPEHDEDGLRRRIKPMTSISGKAFFFFFGSYPYHKLFRYLYLWYTKN
jgi:hypothetical protein